MENSQTKYSIDSLQSSDMQSNSVLKILIVDDAESDRVSYVRYLQSDSERSYSIIEAETLEEGLELWQLQQPDVVLLDINLPDGDGLEFLEAIGTDQLINKLPVIMLTGQGDERIAVRAMKFGAADYLVKGDVTSVLLLTSIAKVHENNLLLKQLRRSQQQQIVIASMALHIRRAHTFEDVSNRIVQEIRSFLNADRAIIYRFNPDMSGEIVAEAVISPWDSCLNVQIEDTCFQENFGGEYQNGKVFVANDIYAANLTECHIQLLERFQVKANLVAPILLNAMNTLWGLLIVHQCDAPRQWHEEDIQLLHQLSTHLAISLYQAELYQNMESLNSSLEEKVQERTQEIQLQAQMLEQIHDAVISTTLDGTILTWNIGAEKLYEYKPHEAIGQNISMLYLTEDLFFMETKIFRPLIEKGTHEVELQNRTKSGNVIDISLRLSIVRDELGNPIRLIGCSNNISDRKQAELELRKSESRFRQLFESDVVGTLFADFQGQITDANDLFLDMLGYTRQELESGLIRWDEITPPEYVAADFHAMSHLLEYGTIGPWEKQYYRKDGSRISVLLGAVLLSGYEDQTICIAVDISDRKQAEQELEQLNHQLEDRVERRTALLRESEQRFISLAAAAPVAIFRINQDNNCTYVNEFWTQITGQEAEVALGYGWIETIHPDDREQIHQQWTQAIEQHAPYQGEGRCIRSDGTISFYYCQTLPEFDDNGVFIGYIGTLTDISDRKQAELQLQKTTDRLALALNSGEIGCWEWDIQQNILVWDDRMYELYGYLNKPDLDMVYEIWANAIHPDDRNATETLLQQAFLGVAEYNCEFRIIHSDQSIHFIKAYGKVKRDSQGNANSMIGINYDISDRKQAEIQLKHINEELLHATKLKDEFLANMSHELRSPLNSILGLSNALREQILGSLNERQIKAIGTVESSGEHLLSLINDILDLSKISSGMMELNVESVSVKNLCDSSLVFVRQQAFQKKVQLNSNIPKNINKINVEERRIRQVLINLLTNAVKFTPSGGQVNLLVAVGGGDTWQGEATIPQRVKLMNSPMIVFQVVDTGIGIAPKDLQRLFQPFVQVSSSLNRQYEGTGLGLALVKQIVELHGGQVMAESEIGKGSSFSVALPYDISQSSTPESTKVSTTSEPVVIDPDHAPLILLAEDNEANIDTFTAYLTAINYRIAIARNGEEAIAMAKSESPDIIIMDIQMPSMDGLEAIRLIRADATIGAIPIIALTALAMEGDHERCLAAGANEYLAKPIKFRELNIVIQQILK